MKMAEFLPLKVYPFTLINLEMILSAKHIQVVDGQPDKHVFPAFIIVSHSNNFCDSLVCIPRQGNLSTRDQPKWKEFTCRSELTPTEKEGQKENGRVASLESLLSHPVTSFLLEIQKLTSFRYPQIGTLKCLSIGTPKIINFPFVSNGKLMFLGVPIFKHIVMRLYSA